MSDETATLSEDLTPAAPPFPTPELKPLPSPPPGVPPLVPDTPELREVLGGRPVPPPSMRVGRPRPTGQEPAAAAPAPGLPLAANLSSTFSGAPAGNPQLKAAVARARDLMGAAIYHLSAAESALPALFESIAPDAAAAAASENFDLTEARAFLAQSTALLDTLRR